MLPIEPPSRQSPEPRGALLGEPVEMLRVGGDVYSVPDLATLQRWILEGRANRADMVSQHGMRWTALGDRPDLALFFSAADAVGARSPTLAPQEAPRPNPAGMMMAEDEEIYVQEVPREEDAPTTFVGTPPAPEAGLAADEGPTLREVPGALGLPGTVMPTLAVHDTLELEDPPTRVDHGDPEPVDELPAEMLVPPRRFVDNPDELRNAPQAAPFRAEALTLGFQIGPDPDTQEATIEETRASASFPAPAPPPSLDLEDAFMRTGVLPTSAPDVTPPRVVLPDSKVPITRTPSVPPKPAPARERSVLDDDYEEPAPKRQGFGVEAAIGALLVLAVLIAGGGYLLRNKGPAEGGAAPASAANVPHEAAPAEAEPAEPAPAEAPPAEGTVTEPLDEVAAPTGAGAADAEAKDAEAKDAEAKDAEEKAAEAKAAEAERAAEAKAAKEAQARADAEAKAAAKAAEREKASAKPPAEPRVASTPPPPKAADPGKGGNAKQLTDQGWKAMDKGDVEGAHGLFSRALQKNGGSADALYGRGYANEKLGDKVSARADYCAALDHVGTDTDLSRELTGSLRRLGVGCGP